MIKGAKIRLIVHNILYSIYKYNKTLNDSYITKKFERVNKQDIAFLYNVTLNSMRYHLHVLKIINKYAKKKLRDHEKILLISATTQIVYLEFEEYAVINCSVEISKKLKLYSGFINACLRKIALNKRDLKEIKIEFNDFPNWFKKRTQSLSIMDKDYFIKDFYTEPDTHIVFKDSEKLNEFDQKLIKTSEISGFITNKFDIKKNKSFIKGDWWVQDFSSFFTLYNFNIESMNKRILDACAAPGGKSFQLLSKNFEVILNDKSKKRIEILKSNLNRLKFNPKILNQDFRNISNNEKFDIIIIDAPCSAVGTIRKNPEIFFKSKGPNFKELINLQKSMLEKASVLLNKGGFIIYMTCSFLSDETIGQITRFLKKNNDFTVYDFQLKKNNISFSRLIKNNFMITLPNSMLNKKIDGYFATYLKKNDINF